MERLAQERGFWNHLHEKANLSGRLIERLNPEFGKTMEHLRKADEKVRGYAENVRNLLRSAKQYYRRRDYLSCAAALSSFHERARYIAAELERFRNTVDLKNFKVLLDQFDDDQKEQLFGYNPTRELQLEDLQEANDNIEVSASLKKQAGLSDWWFKITDPLSDVVHNLTNERAKAMKVLERNFSVAFLKDLKRDTLIMIERSERFVAFLLSTFKKLASALAKRSLDQYTALSKGFVEKFAGYHKEFVKYYEGRIVPLKKEHEKLVAEKKKELEIKQRQEDAAKQQMEAQQQAEMQQRLTEQAKPLGEQLQQQVSTGPLKEPGMMGNKPETLMYQPQNLPNLLPKTMVEQTPDENMPLDLEKQKGASNQEFLERLEIFAEEENPELMVLEILDHSEAMEDQDPEMSLKLLAIAEGIVEEYKTAGVFDFLKGKPQEQKEEEEKEETPPLV
jgi:hypothetical protein